MRDERSDGRRGVLVENLAQGREPQRSLDAVYFITPDPESVERLCADFAAKKPEARLYRRAHVFFSSLPPRSSPP